MGMKGKISCNQLALQTTLWGPRVRYISIQIATGQLHIDAPGGHSQARSARVIRGGLRVQILTANNCSNVALPAASLDGTSSRFERALFDTKS